MSEKPRPLHLRTVALLVMATPVANFAGGLLYLASGMETSEHLEVLGEVLVRTEGLGLVLMLTLTTIGAGFGEELLVRGYMQVRLLQCWPAPIVIIVTSLLFSAMHMDPAHAISVYPLSLWLGFVAWKTGSVWPAMLCHFSNNLISIVIERMTSVEGVESEMFPLSYLAFVAVGAGALGFALLDLRAGHWLSKREQQGG